MPKGTCDPSPEAFNEQIIAKADGNVTFRVLYGPNGVWPDCTGPIESVQIRNTLPAGGATYWAHVPNRTGTGTKDIAIAPGFNQTFSGNQVRQQGMELLATISGLLIDRNPTDPRT